MFLEYKELFEIADMLDDKCMQCSYILAVFFIIYANTINNARKPFNSFLGETWEYVEKETGFKLLTE